MLERSPPYYHCPPPFPPLPGYPNFNPKAPRQVLTDFAGGVWLTWELTGSVRLRISSISGDYAALSAVAFDPAP